MTNELYKKLFEKIALIIAGLISFGTLVPQVISYLHQSLIAVGYIQAFHLVNIVYIFCPVLAFVIFLLFAKNKVAQLHEKVTSKQFLSLYWYILFLFFALIAVFVMSFCMGYIYSVGIDILICMLVIYALLIIWGIVYIIRLLNKSEIRWQAIISMTVIVGSIIFLVSFNGFSSQKLNINSSIDEGKIFHSWNQKDLFNHCIKDFEELKYNCYLRYLSDSVSGITGHHDSYDRLHDFYKDAETGNDAFTMHLKQIIGNETDLAIYDSLGINARTTYQAVCHTIDTFIRSKNYDIRVNQKKYDSIIDLINFYETSCRQINLGYQRVIQNNFGFLLKKVQLYGMTILIILLQVAFIFWIIIKGWSDENSRKKLVTACETLLIFFFVLILPILKPVDPEKINLENSTYWSFSIGSVFNGNITSNIKTKEIDKEMETHIQYIENNTDHIYRVIDQLSSHLDSADTEINDLYQHLYIGSDKHQPRPKKLR